MTTQLGQTAGVNDGDAVGAAHGGETVCDHDDGARHHQRLQRVFDLGLGARIEVRGGLVQHQHGGIDECGPGERDQLPLPRRQSRATLTHLGVQPPGERQEVFERTDGGERVLDLSVAG